MEAFHPSDNDAEKEVAPVPPESLTPQGVSAMKGGVENSSLPSPNNLETYEISKMPEATPGRDGTSVPAPVTTDDSNDNSKALGQKRIESSTLGRASMQGDVSGLDQTDTLQPVSPSIPGYDTNTPKTTEASGDWKDLGIVDVPVADLPNPDGISSPSDFNHHITWEDAKSATEQLPQVQREVAAGKTGEDFSAEDQAAGLDWQNGRRRVYDLYYSNTDPVQVDKIGDTYTINSGRHRIFAAKELGLATIPARVKEKYG